MNWYIGQEIAAIRNHPQLPIKEGDTFFIKGLMRSLCKCEGVVIDIGLSVSTLMCCDTCATYDIDTNGIAWLTEKGFRPLDSLADISELTEILETTKPYEV